MAKKRVLHVVRRLDVSRGAERLIAELVRTQPNHDVLVFDGDGSFYDLGEGKLFQVWGFIPALCFCLRRKNRYDVFHLHMVPACYLALFLMRRAVIHVHNSHYERRNRAIVRVLDWMTHRMAGATITVSDEASAGMRAFIGNVPRMHALANFVAELGPGGQPVSRTTDETHILMVASLEAPKRQDILIRALARLPDRFCLSLAGTGAKEQALRELSAELGLTDRVAFLGAVKDIASCYGGADLCALISDWEGFGLVVLEAAQLGKPTVVSDVAGLRESCPDARFIVPEPTSQAVADKIVEVAKLKDDASVQKALSQHARSHGVDAYVLKLDTIYGT